MAHRLITTIPEGIELPATIALYCPLSIQFVSIPALREASPFFDDLLANDVEPGGAIRIPYTRGVLKGIVRHINNCTLSIDADSVQLYAASKRYRMYVLTKKLRQDLIQYFKQAQFRRLNDLFRRQRLEHLLELRDIFTICNTCDSGRRSIPSAARRTIAISLQFWAQLHNVCHSELNLLTRVILNPADQPQDAEVANHAPRPAFDQVTLLTAKSLSTVSAHGKIVKHRRRRIPGCIQKLLEVSISPVVIGNKIYLLKVVYSNQIQVYSFDTGEYLYSMCGVNDGLLTLTVHKGRLYAASGNQVYVIQNAECVLLGTTKHKMASRLLVMSHSDTGDFHCVHSVLNHSTKFVFMKRNIYLSMEMDVMGSTGADVEVDYEELIGSTITDLIGCHKGLVYMYGHKPETGSFILMVNGAVVVRRIACDCITPCNYMNCSSQICLSEGNVLVIVNVSDLYNIRLTKTTFQDNIILVRRSIPIRNR